jgi:hypothetical protein
MAKSKLKEKQDSAADVPLGNGMAEKTKQTIRNRQKELDDRLQGLFNDKPKKKSK